MDDTSGIRAEANTGIALAIVAGLFYLLSFGPAIFLHEKIDPPDKVGKALALIYFPHTFVTERIGAYYDYGRWWQSLADR